MRAGLVEQTELLNDALRSIQSKTVTAFIGPAVSGKTTFLEIVEMKIKEEQKSPLSIRVGQGTTTPNLIRQLAVSTQLSIQNDGDEFLAESLITHLNENRICLIIDDYQNLVDGNEFTISMLDRLKEARLLFSSTALPAIHRDRVFEMGIVRARPLNIDEVTQLVGSVSIPSSTSELMPAISRLHELSSGAPDLIKLALGDLYVSGQPLTKSTVEEAFKSAQTERIARITSSTSQKTKSTLLAAALVKFDSNVENLIVDSISENERKHLIDLGMIISKSGQYVVQHRELWAKLNFDLGSGRNFVIEAAGAFKTFNSTREQIYQLRDLQDWDRLVAKFESTFAEYESFWSFDEIAMLTDSILEHLSADLMGHRAVALRACGKHDQCLNELLIFRQFKLSPREQRWIDYQILRTKMFTNTRDDLHEGFYELFKASKPDERSYYRALAVCLRFDGQLKTGKLSDTQLEELFSSTMSLIKSHFSDDKVFIAHTLSEFGLIFQRQGLAKRRDECLEDSLTIYSSINPASFDTLFARMLVVKKRNELHLSEAARVCSQITEEARVLGFHYVELESADINFFYSCAQGKAASALELIRRAWQGNLNKISTIYLHHALAALYAWLIQGNRTDAHQYLKGLLNSLNVNSDHNYMYSIRRIIECFDHLASPDQSAIPSIQVSEEITEENLYNLTSALSLIDLESYFTFDQFFERMIARLDWNNKIFIRNIALTQPHYAWRELLAGRFKIADQHFSAAVELSRREEMYFYQFRSLSGMIVLALQEDQFARARDLLAEAKSIAPLMDSVEGLPELHLLPILETLYLIRTNEKPAARVLLQATKKFKRYEFLRQSLLNELGINTREEVYNPGAAEKKFSERLLELTKVKLQNRYEFRDHLNTHSILEELPKLRKGYDFVWDRVKGELLIGREKFELQDKPLIEELLYFLVCHPNESYTKEQLIGFVWRETYNPLVHDSRIYTSVKRIRQMFASLGEKEVVIQDAGRYGLSREIKFAVLSRAAQELPILPRQKWVIEFVDQNGTIDRLTAEKVLDISAAQVKRDLKDLVDRGFLSIDGNGRAAKYVRGRTS